MVFSLLSNSGGNVYSPSKGCFNPKACPISCRMAS